MYWSPSAPSTGPSLVAYPSIPGTPTSTVVTAAPSSAMVGQTPARPVNIPPSVSAPVSAALLGAVIGGANAFGRNMYHVQQGEMTVSQAVVRGLMHGAATSLATTTATVLTANVTDSDALHLAALAATAAGLSYLISAGAHTALQRRDAGA
ncbi:hypothetical protein [uncultured Desulfosarcina sp.]|uniref:hypothetical protein n=1 Tax=uncultured Desulfosarcina sp. TaxID=218289 RepID=UPI0029C7A2A7|nr:hypothetical protein [uncultured Desulfosarcina sp.]